jgi:hypothetical protein
VAAGIPTPPHYHVPTPPHYHVPTPPHYHTGHSAGAFDWLGYFGGCGWSANACEPLPFDCQFPIVETESGMRIDQLGMYAVIPGGELEIVGSHFGAAQGSKIVALSKDGLVGAEVMSWSDQSIRIRIPEGIPYGKYKVLIYYDDSLSTSSNSKSVLVVGGL